MIVDKQELDSRALAAVRRAENQTRNLPYDEWRKVIYRAESMSSDTIRSAIAESLKNEVRLVHEGSWAASPLNVMLLRQIRAQAAHYTFPQQWESWRARQ